MARCAGGWWAIECTKPDCFGGVRPYVESEVEAVAAWNRRSPSVPEATQEKPLHQRQGIEDAVERLANFGVGNELLLPILHWSRGVPSSEEAANSDTIRLSAFVAELHANAPSGMTCPKKPHVGGGHLHAEDDDRPYLVDGMWYCGRCHYACNGITHRCDNPRTA